MTMVSIHAPARGATGSNTITFSKSSGFNPRARAGRDKGVHGELYKAVTFQSTRPRGARLGGMIASLSSVQFQSTRPRGARRLDGFGREALGLVSIHAPARGATLRDSLAETEG